MKEEWIALWKDRAYFSMWILALCVVLAVLKFVSVFLVYNEERTGGLLLNDYILSSIEPKDVSTLLFSITWVCIFVCLPIGLRTPKRALVVFLSIIVIGLIRCVTLYLVHLEAPIDTIPLRDPLLECSFYENRILLKDLFFSGHTANLALLIFLIDIRWLKIILIICTSIVGFLLLKQHAHYTIDVVAAPFFAYISYRIASWIAYKIHTRIRLVPAI